MEAAADKVLTAAQVLISDRCKGHGDAAVELDRDLVATICGYSSAKKCGWLFDYLQSIGFLVIERRHAAPAGDGSRRGRQTDTFVTFDEPPLNYVGPRTYAELSRALRDPNRPLAAILFVDDGTQNSRSDRRCPCGDLRCGPRCPHGDLGRISSGQTEGAHVGTFGADQGAHMGTLVRDPAGQTEGAQIGTFPRARSDLIDSSPRRRGEESIEPGAGEAAEPPAPGKGEQASPEVVDLVRRLPWREWSQQTGSQLTVSVADVEQVQVAIQTAMTREGITLEQAQEVACAAMRDTKSNPVKYVVGAFDQRRLPDRLRMIQVASLADDPLPLVLSEASGGSPRATKSPGSDARKVSGKGASEGEYVPPKPACDRCGAAEGAEAARRGWETESGWVWCECRALAVRPA